MKKKEKEKGKRNNDVADNEEEGTRNPSQSE